MLVSSGPNMSFYLSFSFHPEDITLTWSYGEAHHFKGPHDEISETIKRKVYLKVLSAKVVIENAKQFSEAVNRLCDITVIYLNAEYIEPLNLTDSIYARGTLKVHHVRRLTPNLIGLYLNSTINKSSNVF